MFQGQYPHKVEFSHNQQETKNDDKQAEGQKSVQDYFTKCKRPSESSNNEHQPSKRMKVDKAEPSTSKEQNASGADSSEDSEQEEIRRKFEAFKKEMKKYPKPKEKHSSAEAVNASKGKVTEDGEDGSGKFGVGEPRNDSRWEEPDKTLLVFSSKGMRSSSKVRILSLHKQVCTGSIY